MPEFDPNNCPIGLVHEKDIPHNREMFEMAIQRIEDHIATVKQDVNEGFANVNEHFESVDKRFDILEKKLNKVEEDLPSTIDERINSNTGAKALNILKWVIVSLGGSITITIITRLILNSIHL